VNLFEAEPDGECLRYKRYGESDYAYYSKSSRPEILSIRAQLEEMYAGFPEGQRKAALKREIESSEGHFYAPFFEILLHKTFSVLGCKVTIEPDPGNGVTSRPDFLIETPQGNSFYCEAVHSTGQSKAEYGSDKLLFDLLDKVNEKFTSPKFSWQVSRIDRGLIAPSAKQIVHQLNKHQETLDWEEVFAWERTCENSTTVASNGWSLTFSPRAKRKEAWCKLNAKPIYMLIGRLTDSLTAQEIREEIRTKRRQHVGLTRPLVVAVNSGQFDVFTEDIFEALYGSLNYQVNSCSEKNLEPSRGLNGIWLGRDGPKHSNLPYVIVGKHMTPGGFSEQSLEIFPNPYIDRDELIELPLLPRWEFNEGIGSLAEGPSLGSLFATSQV
jgi:hypothetical protein